MEISPHPDVRLTQLYPDAPPPVPADRSLSGSVLLRAWQHCEPFLAASGWGWWVYAPFQLAVLYDGTDVYWTRLDDPTQEHGDDPVWHGQSLPLPGFSEVWAEHEPDLEPPSFISLGEPGLIQIFPGVVGSTAPGWSLLVRGAVNIPQKRGFEVLEGIIETDWYRGPLAPVVRLTKIDEPIIFATDVPLFSIVPVPRNAYIGDLGEVSPPGAADYVALRDARAHRQATGEVGLYRKATRQRRREEVDAQ